MYIKFLQGFIDILLSGIGIIVFAVPMLIVAVVIKIEDPGSTIFKQKCVGYHKKYFNLCKFRSMKMGDLPMQVLTDPQSNILNGGEFIRKTVIDELPQTWNVFKGNYVIMRIRLREQMYV